VFHDHASEFDAGTHPEFAKDLAQVRVDRVTGEKQTLPDLAIRQPGRDEAGDVSFRVPQGSPESGADACFCCRHDLSVRLGAGRRILRGA
jgi:hypothetical protein